MPRCSGLSSDFRITLDLFFNSVLRVWDPFQCEQKYSGAVRQWWPLRKFVRDGLNRDGIAHELETYFFRDTG